MLPFARFMSCLALIVAPALLVAGCDRQSGDAAQPAGKDGSNQAQLRQGEKMRDPVTGLTGTLDIAQRGAAMPDISIEDPEGEPIALTSFIGKPLLVNLWATWCGPCVIEMPALDKLALREGERLNVLVVSQDIQGAEVVDPFFNEQDFEALDPYLDPENKLGFHYATGVLPTTILYDAKGREVWRVIGGMDWNGSRAAALMAETLDGGGV